MPRHLVSCAFGGTAIHTVLSVTLPFIHLWFERDGGSYWRWDWTILRIVIGKQEIRTDLALNNWGLGFVMHETDDWSVHVGPLDIECEL